jgi:hypothetical protein
MRVVDTTTGIVRRLSYSPPDDEQGPWLDDIFEDYRDVSGVKFAFRLTTRRDTQPLRERIVKEVVVNPALEASLFDKSRLK